MCRYLPELWVNTNSFAATKDNVSVSPAVMPDVLKSSILLHYYWWVLAASAAVWVSSHSLGCEELLCLADPAYCLCAAWTAQWSRERLTTSPIRASLHPTQRASVKVES